MGSDSGIRISEFHLNVVRIEKRLEEKETTMNRLNWITRIANERTADAEARYWLAKELQAHGRTAEALAEYGKGLGICTDENLRQQFIAALTEASIAMQAGSTMAETAASANLASTTSPDREDDPSPKTAIGLVLGSEAHSEAPANQENCTCDDDRDTEGEVQDDEDEEDFEDDDYDELPEELDGDRGQTYRTQAGLQVVQGGKARQDKPASSEVPGITFSDVAGLAELKKTIQLRIISPFQHQSLFSKFRKKTGGGVLLYGPPGCGKTYMARATAGECRARFIPVSITDVLDPYIGVSEQNLKNLFDKARAQKPSIMFFDEVDTIGYSRSKSSSNMRGVIDTFLTEMEGIDTSTDQILVLGATNMPWDVDNALKRPGRFDRMVFVAPPDAEARKQLFQLKLAERHIGDIDYEELANRTEFFSGADIDNLCERAAEKVLGDILETGRERAIGMDDMLAVLGHIRPSTMEWLKTAKNYVKYANQSGIFDDVELYLKEFGRRI